MTVDIIKTQFSRLKIKIGTVRIEVETGNEPKTRNRKLT